ncbi:DUF3883 domain-containing protein [candidate division KSB1 bacterium]|nr:DUF3883 domain-containing protein [candidate division KSB1 bacterium]
MTAIDLIRKIQDEHISSSERTLRTLKGAIETIKITFPYYGSFLMEFVQNADDEKSNFIRFEIKDKTVTVTNDGRPFTKKNVESICSISESTKDNKNYIGYLGVGFKSVFLISDSPEIHSGDFHFKFDKNHWKKFDFMQPYEILPISIKAPPIQNNSVTTFSLPIQTKANINKISKEFGQDVFNSRTILFLRNISKFELIDHNKNKTRIIEKKKYSSTKQFELYSIIEKRRKRKFEQSDWVVFRKKFTVPKKVKKDKDTIQWKRDEVDKREVAVAFRIENGKLSKEEEGTAYIGVFSFLPLKEVVSGMNFIIQADFLTGAGRSEISRDKLWNDWMAKEIQDLIISKCIPIFLKHSEWKYNFTDILFSDEGGHELISKRIKIPVNKYLKSNDILIDKNGNRCSYKNSVMVSNALIDNIDTNDMNILFYDKTILHANCEPSNYFKIKKHSYDDFGDLLDYSFDRLTRLLEFKAKKRDVAWFINFYNSINEKYGSSYFYNKFTRYNVEHDRFWDSVSRKRIILTNRFQLKTPQECYVNEQKLPIPEELKTTTFIVLPRLTLEDQFIDFRNSIRESRGHRNNPKVLEFLSQEIIKKKLEDEFVKKLTESKWKRLNRDKKIQYVKLLKQKNDDYSIDLDYYKPFITLLSMAGNFKFPSQLIFSSEYDSDHDLEKLVNYRLLNSDVFSFLSSDYLDGTYNQWRWISFFKKLGVDSILNDSKRDIVEKIGVSVAKQYEKENNRIPIETGSSEKERCDIISNGNSNVKRYIEVKSRSDERWDLELTNNQTEKVYEYVENYFVYIVLNALRSPKLKIIRGDILKEIGKIKISIPFNDWNKPENINDQFVPF